MKPDDMNDILTTTLESEVEGTEYDGFSEQNTIWPLLVKASTEFRQDTPENFEADARKWVSDYVNE